MTNINSKSNLCTRQSMFIVKPFGCITVLSNVIKVSRTLERIIFSDNIHTMVMLLNTVDTKLYI